MDEIQGPSGPLPIVQKKKMRPGKTCPSEPRFNSIHRLLNPNSTRTPLGPVAQAQPPALPLHQFAGDVEAQAGAATGKLGSGLKYKPTALSQPLRRPMSPRFARNGSASINRSAVSLTARSPIRRHHIPIPAEQLHQFGVDEQFLLAH